MNQQPDDNISLERRAQLLASEAWARLTTPSTVGGLLLAAGVALGLIFWVSSGGGSTWRELSGEGNPVLARFDAILGLHAPWEAWWVVVIGVAAIVSLTAFLIERSPWWGLRPGGRKDLPRRKLIELDPEQVRAAAACIGEDVKVAEGGGQVALLTLSSLHRIALPALVLGAVVLSGGIVTAVRGTILGEMVLVPDQTTVQVHTPGTEGQPSSRGLPLALQVVSVAPSGERAEVTLPGAEANPIQISPNAPLRTGTTWILPRHTRQADGGERFRIRLVGPDGEGEESLVVVRESVALEGSDSAYRIRSYTDDLNGAGPAAWVERMAKDEVAEGFWVFERVPGFDGPNRADPIAFELLGVERQHQLVVGVVHLVGLELLGAGVLLFLLGLGLLMMAVRGSRMVGFGNEEAWGYPADDAGVGRALQVLTTGGGE